MKPINEIFSKFEKDLYDKNIKGDIRIVLSSEAYERLSFEIKQGIFRQHHEDLKERFAFATLNRNIYIEKSSENELTEYTLKFGYEYGLVNAKKTKVDGEVKVYSAKEVDIKIEQLKEKLQKIVSELEFYKNKK